LHNLGDEYGSAREGFLLRKKADQQEQEQQVRARSVEARVQTLQTSVDRMRKNLGILLLIVIGWSIVAIARSFL
jgi:hypothetical protein